MEDLTSLVYDVIGQIVEMEARHVPVALLKAAVFDRGRGVGASTDSHLAIDLCLGGVTF
jgi:hypothetical protein